MNRKFNTLTLLFFILLKVQLFGSWEPQPTNHLISYAHVIVTGTADVSEKNRECTPQSEDPEHKIQYKLANIKIDSVLKNDLIGIEIKNGDSISIRVSTQEKTSSVDRGIWLLNYEDNRLRASTVNYLLPLKELSSVKEAITKFDTLDRKSIENEILKRKAKSKELLAQPALSPKDVDIAIMKGIPPEITLERVHVVNLFGRNCQSLLLDQKGTLIGAIPYYSASNRFSNSLLPISTLVKNNVHAEYNFINPKGEFLLEAPCSLISPFSEGLAIVWRGNRCGFVDRTGKLIVPCIYDSASPFSGGMAMVETGANRSLINIAGKVILTGKSNEIFQPEEGLSYVNLSGKTVGFVNNTGKIVLNTKEKKYSTSKFFRDGLVKIMFNRTEPVHYGFIDKSGKLVIKPKPWRFGQPSEGLIPFSKNYNACAKWGYMDKSGKIVIEPRFHHAGSFSNERAVVEYSHWMKRPKIISNDKSIKLSTKAFPYIQNSTKGLINKKGEIITKFAFNSGKVMRDLAEISIYHPKKSFRGLINKKGEVVLVLTSPEVE